MIFTVGWMWDQFEWSKDPETLRIQVQMANQIYWAVYGDEIMKEKEKCAPY